VLCPTGLTLLQLTVCASTLVNTRLEHCCDIAVRSPGSMPGSLLHRQHADNYLIVLDNQGTLLALRHCRLKGTSLRGRAEARLPLFLSFCKGSHHHGCPGDVHPWAAWGPGQQGRVPGEQRQQQRQATAATVLHAAYQLHQHTIICQLYLHLTRLRGSRAPAALWWTLLWRQGWL
jgi:hypothetical protein